MKKIPLTQGKVALVDDEDYESLILHKWYLLRKPHTCYALRNISVGGKVTTSRMHREILNAPHGVDVDHRDCDGLNNQRFNIRLCSRSQNLMNQRGGRKSNASGYKGVSLSRKKKPWRALIWKDCRRASLGNYDTEIEAAKAYDNAAKELFGEFARLNFPEATAARKSG